jgi:hypothetical protein
MRCGTLQALTAFNVGGGYNSHNGSFTYLNHAAIGYGIDYGNRKYTIYSEGVIGCAAEINVWSDKRIKRNIQDIDSESALNIILNLQPKRYNYVDFVKNVGNKDSIGFVAQDVFTAFPEAVSTAQDWIPNIYDVGTLVESDVIELKNKKTTDFEINGEVLDIKVKLFINNEERIVHVKEILDDARFRLKETITTEITDNSLNQIFVYGQEVDNLLNLEKNAIFTMAVGSIKKLHEELEDVKTQMKKMQEQIDLLLSLRV